MDIHDSKLIFILDFANLEKMLNEKSLKLMYSHDKYGLSFGLHFDSFLYDVYYSSIQLITPEKSEVYKISKKGNSYEFDRTVIEVEKGDFIFADITILSQLMNVKGYKIGFAVAMHWIESPTLHPPEYFNNFLFGLKNAMDLLLTNNTRMKEVMSHLYEYLIPFNEDSIDSKIQVIQSPLKFEKEFLRTDKTKLSKKISKWINVDLKEYKLIVNAGGIWCWVDFYNFVKDFILFCKKNPETKFKLVITGFANNVSNLFEHEEQIMNIKKTLINSQDICCFIDEKTNLKKVNISKNKIIIINDWDTGGEVLIEILPMASLGLSINLRNLEGWQSLRQRNNNYIMNQVPILSAGFGLDASLNDSNLGFISINKFNGSYYETIEYLEKNPKALEDLKNEIIKLNKTLLSQIDHKFLKSILKKAEKNYTLYRQDTSVYDYRILD